MDDSLSDTQQWNKTFDMLVKDADEIEQQEKKQMSVKQLVLNGNTSTLIVKEIGKEVLIRITSESTTLLDRSQAQLLMLYLQEHLGYVSISKDRLND